MNRSIKCGKIFYSNSIYKVIFIAKFNVHMKSLVSTQQCLHLFCTINPVTKELPLDVFLHYSCNFNETFILSNNIVDKG